MDKLADCYEELKVLLGSGIEPIEAVRAVEAHRQFWRPERSRLVLLAESHVYTRSDELVPLLPNAVVGLPPIPGPYVRFVYCLGYGEKTLVDAKVLANSGTPQFWKILYSCANFVRSSVDFSPILVSRTPRLQERLLNKLRLLESLKQYGVWLVDASIVGLYRPKADKLSQDVVGVVIEKSWDGYVGEVIRQASPEHIIVIGRGVAAHLRGRLSKLVGDRWCVLPQPQARLPSSDHFEAFQSYFRICSRYMRCCK